MWPLSHQPLESLAVRWQQRFCRQAGSPFWSSHSTMFSPSNVNGLGPSLRSSTRKVAYQKRRNTFCWVVCMGIAPFLAEPAGGSWSDFEGGFALVPFAERQARQSGHDDEQHDSGGGD